MTWLTDGGLRLTDAAGQEWEITTTGGGDGTSTLFCTMSPLGPSAHPEDTISFDASMALTVAGSTPSPAYDEFPITEA